jgi:hypothetical protein
MPIIRNPFSRKANGETLNVDQHREGGDYFERKEPPSSIEINKEPVEYKMCGEWRLRPTAICPSNAIGAKSEFLAFPALVLMTA